MTWMMLAGMSALSFQVPTDLKSGVYGARLTAGGSEDYVPFFVRPANGASLAKILFLVPTNSYLPLRQSPCVHPNRVFRTGWVCAHDPSRQVHRRKTTRIAPMTVHTDGSPVFYTSRLRPIVTMRPKYNFWYPHMGRGGPWQFNADLHLVDWLDELGYDYDVAHRRRPPTRRCGALWAL